MIFPDNLCTSESRRFIFVSRSFQPLRQQRAGGNPAGVQLRGLGRPVNRLALGEVDGAVAVEINGGTEQQAGQLVAGQFDRREVGVHAGERHAGQFHGRVLAEHAHDFGDQRGVGALPPVAAAAGRQKIQLAVGGGAPVERRLLDVAVGRERGHLTAAIAGDIGGDGLAGNGADRGVAEGAEATDDGFRIGRGDLQTIFFDVMHIDLAVAGQRIVQIAGVRGSGLGRGVNGQNGIAAHGLLVTGKKAEHQSQPERDAQQAKHPYRNGEDEP